MSKHRELTYTATVTKRLDDRLADLVYFVRYCQETGCTDASDDSEGDARLVAAAASFWDRQHGE